VRYSCDVIDAKLYLYRITNSAILESASANGHRACIQVRSKQKSQFHKTVKFLQIHIIWHRNILDIYHYRCQFNHIFWELQFAELPECIAVSKLPGLDPVSGSAIWRHPRYGQVGSPSNPELWRKLPNGLRRFTKDHRTWPNQMVDGQTDIGCQLSYSLPAVVNRTHVTSIYRPTWCRSHQRCSYMRRLTDSVCRNGGQCRHFQSFIMQYLEYFYLMLLVYSFMHFAAFQYQFK
jgi:hypothetical protein